MMLMEKKTEKKSKLTIVIIILLVVVIALTATIGYFLLSGNKIPDRVKKVKPPEEHTVLLNEFLVNLRFENNKKNYLKVQIALMYTEKKQTILIDSNVSKIRDIILSELRKNSADEILDVDKITNLKDEIIKKLNLALDDDVIKDVYFTDLVIQ